MNDKPLDILVTDDDEAVRVALTEILLLSGYAVHPAADGQEALRILHTEKIDLLITDLMMPGMSGVELVEQAAQVYPHLPSIILSAFGTIERARDSLRRGAVDFLTKPVSSAELIIAVERNLERRQLEAEKLSRATAEARAEILFSAIRALAAAIDLRDPYTAGHSQRVEQIADRLAPAAAVPESERYVLRLAGAMHDIGKIGIRDAVLRKPGPLSEAERAEVRLHPQRGSEIINNIAELGQVATIIRHHHENIDGSGYPDGLRGEAIPYLARILAVADAYEALTADRSYRKALPAAGAFAILRAEAGHRYDPAIVDILVDLVERGELDLDGEPE